MPDRKTTKRMFTHMINMMEKHDTMTISCGDPLMELLKDVRELLKEQEAVEPRVSSAEQRCGHCNKVIEMDKWKACPWCGKMIDWERWWKKNENT